MPIPGLRPQWEVVAKVRVGEKVMRGGRELPSSTDHFVCDDAAFVSTVGNSAKEIFITLPDRDESFTSGLEWWQGQMLACYSKGDKHVASDGTETDDYEAYRLPTMLKGGRTINLLEGFRVLTEEKKGKERAIIACPVRDCPDLKLKNCRPKGRLRFWIDGIDRNRGVYQFDTQSWNTIEKIEGTLARFPDPRGVPFLLRVTMVSNGRDRYPVVSLEAGITSPEAAAPVAAFTPDKAWFDLLAKGGYLLDADVNLAEGTTPEQARKMLAEILDYRFPGWRENEKIVARVKEVGVGAAMSKMITEGLAS